jgi:Helix-turn-helix domain
VEAADLTGLSRTQIVRLAAAGRIPVALKLPTVRGAYLFRVADLEHYLDTRRPPGRPRRAEIGTVDAAARLSTVPERAPDGGPPSPVRGARTRKKAS